MISRKILKILLCKPVLHCVTVWKLENFSALQILREINLQGFRSSKNAIFWSFRASDLWIGSKMADFKLWKHKKLISRKIWVAGKYWNFPLQSNYEFIFMYIQYRKSMEIVYMPAVCLKFTLFVINTPVFIWNHVNILNLLTNHHFKV